MAYTVQDITKLISCSKKILDPPKRDMRVGDGFRRNDMTLVSDGVPGFFHVFMRQSEDFQENFSIGLRYDPKDGTGDITLIRCNGPHGAYNGNADPSHPHWDFHVHRASPEAIANGFRAEKYAEKTLEFASLEEALRYFLRETNVDPGDVETYFPGHSRQLDLDWQADVQ
jgi:hypothetical protein